MSGPLTILPVRLTLRTARRALSTTRDVAELGLVVLDVADRVLTRSAAPSRPTSARPSAGPRPVRAEPGRPFADPGPGLAEPTPRRAGPGPRLAEPTPRRAGPGPRLAEPGSSPAGPRPRPTRPSTEPELVAEVAEPGAEDGAGAAVRIAEPFPGFDALRAPDVIARLRTVDAAELGAIELYETAHRSRRTVLDAIAREARRRAASA